MLMLLSSSISMAQTIDSTDNDVQLMIENIASSTDAEIKYDIEPTQLLYFAKHPINLNKASFDALKQVGLLTEIQINNIINYIKNNGELNSIYELQSITTLDLITIKRILPYVKVDGSIDDYQIPISKILTTGRYQLISRINSTFQTPMGYKPDATTVLPSNKYYEGNKYRVYNRFNYSFGNKLSYGITTEKDAGEAFLKGSQKQGFDFYSAHFFIRTNKRMETIAIGDYEIRIGQGLLMYTGFGYTKTALITSIKKETNILMPYKSSNEFSFLRGAAFTYKFNKHHHLTPFISYRKLDGNVVLNDSTLATDDAITSIQQGGYHRTKTEIENKNTQSLSLLGANYSFQKNNFKLGFSSMFAQYGLAIQKTNQPYSLYNFTGKNWHVSGADYSYIYKNINFFGEASFNNNKQYAIVNGLIAALDAKLDVAILYRKYTPGYYSLYSLGFSENTNNINEEGFYTGFIAKLNNQFSFSTYADFFKFPWLKFGIDAPTSGVDYFLQSTYKPDKETELYIRYQYKNKQTNVLDATNSLAKLTNEILQSIRFNGNYRASKTITMHNKVDVKVYQIENQKAATGIVILQDVSYHPIQKPYDFMGRIALFNAPNYNTRIYSFEQDVPGSYSVPMLYGKGFHGFIMMSYKINRKLEFWCRLAETYYPENTSTGSGLELINTNHKTEWKMQLRWTL
ncbi:MAG: hypothetical protein RJA07_1549 [Bacteroidota bacterium]|jgi:hypothetical protein